MPNGRIHALSNITVAISGATVMLIQGQDANCVIGIVVGSFAGTFFGPDNDIDSGHIADYFIKRYTGRVVETAWTMLWLLYRKAFKHRSFLSHFPLISTCIRILYLSCFYFLIAIPARLVSDFVKIDWLTFLFWAFVGLVLADTAHYGLDKLDEMFGGIL